MPCQAAWHGITVVFYGKIVNFIFAIEFNPFDPKQQRSSG